MIILQTGVVIMKTKLLVLAVLLVSMLTACGEEETESTTLLNTFMEVDTDLLTLVNNGADSVHQFAVGDTLFTTVVPDGYTQVKVESTEYYTPLLAFTSTGNFESPVTYIAWFTIATDEIGSVIHNPFMVYADETTVGMFPYPEVGTLSHYITGSDSIAGVACKNYVDFTKVSASYPAIYMPENYYVFNMRDNLSLVLLVSYTPEDINDLFNAVEQAISGQAISYDLSEMQTTYEVISLTLDQIATECCRFSALGDLTTVSDN